MTKKRVFQSLTEESQKTAPIEQKKPVKHFAFTGIFKKFEVKHRDFGEDLFGFILEDICEIPKKSLIIGSQWFHLTEKFKKAFENYRHEALAGKKIQFEGIKEMHKKGYYTYQDNVIISGPDDLEYKILRPTKIKILST